VDHLEELAPDLAHLLVVLLDEQLPLLLLGLLDSPFRRLFRQLTLGVAALPPPPVLEVLQETQPVLSTREA
jgi:hypothetical protein